jgi:hypothetical protein
MFDIKIAKRSFWCPVTELRTLKGDAYLENDYGRYHISLLPARRLRFIRRRQKTKTTTS